MNGLRHLAIFMKMNLRNLLEVAGFLDVKVRRLPKVLFARLEAKGRVGEPVHDEERGMHGGRVGSLCMGEQ